MDRWRDIRARARVARTLLGPRFADAPAQAVLDALLSQWDVALDLVAPHHPLLRGARAAWREEYDLILVDRTLPAPERAFAIAHVLGHLYQRYAQAYDSGTLDQIDPHEAAGLLQQFMQNAPADLQQQVYQESFSQMSPQRRQALALELAQRLPPQYAVNTNDPQQMAQGIVQVAQQRPDLLLEACGLGRSPVADVVVVELAALAAKNLLNPLASAAVPVVRDVAVPLVQEVAVPLVRDVVGLLR